MNNFGFGYLGGCILIFMAMTACHSKPVSLEEASLTPSTRRLAFQDTTHPGYGRVTVIRDKGVRAPGCYIEIYVDDTLAARIDKGEQVTFYLPPGPLELKIATDLQGKAVCKYDPRPCETNQNKGEAE